MPNYRISRREITRLLMLRDLQVETAKQDDILKYGPEAALTPAAAHKSTGGYAQDPFAIVTEWRNGAVVKKVLNSEVLRKWVPLLPPTVDSLEVELKDGSMEFKAGRSEITLWDSSRAFPKDWPPIVLDERNGEFRVQSDVTDAKADLTAVKGKREEMIKLSEVFQKIREYREAERSGIGILRKAAAGHVQDLAYLESMTLAQAVEQVRTLRQAKRAAKGWQTVPLDTPAWFTPAQAECFRAKQELYAVAKHMNAQMGYNPPVTGRESKREWRRLKAQRQSAESEAESSLRNFWSLGIRTHMKELYGNDIANNAMYGRTDVYYHWARRDVRSWPQRKSALAARYRAIREARIKLEKDLGVGNL